MVIGTNIFAYCNNNPVNNSDSYGYAAGTLSAAAIASIIVKVIAVVGIVLIISAILNNSVYKSAINDVGRLNTKFKLAKSAIIAVLSTTIMQTYSYAKSFKKSLAITVSSAITMSSALAEINEKVKRKSKDRYWDAILLSTKAGSKYIKIGRAITYYTAKANINKFQSVFTVTENEAHGLAMACGGIHLYHPNRKQEGYYPHYHPKSSKKSHIWWKF